MMHTVSLRVSEETLTRAQHVGGQRGQPTPRVNREALELGLLLLAAMSPADAQGFYAGMTGAQLDEALRPQRLILQDFHRRYGSPTDAPGDPPADDEGAAHAPAPGHVDHGLMGTISALSRLDL